MKCTAAIAVVAMFAWPAFAQRGAGNGAGFGSRGFGGHAGSSARPGFSGHVGFGHGGRSEPGGYAPAPPFRYGSLGPPPAVRFDPPNISAPHIGVSQNGIIMPRPAYREDFAGRARTWDRHGGDRGWDHGRNRNGDHDWDRDRFRGRARSFENWYLYSYPGWVGYDYPYDLGFYDGPGYDNSGYDQNDQASGYENESPGSQPQYPNGEYGESSNGNGGEGNGEPGGAYGQPGEQPQPWPEPPASEPSSENHFWVSGQSAAIAPPLEGPLMVIFKGGRAPEQMQNYMLTATTLTDLDADHYEQIPLDQIDFAATARANRASGLEFRVPGASHD